MSRGRVREAVRERPDTIALARLAYEAHTAQAISDLVPSWNQLDRDEQRAWCAVVDALLEAVGEPDEG